MKSLRITVNGKIYEVQVEETDSVEIAPQPTQNNSTITTPAQQEKPVETAKPAASTAGQSVTSPMPGNILDVKVSQGDSVKMGQILIMLEAMKMENEITSPCDGIVSSVLVKKGDTVDAGAVMVTIG